MDIDTSNSRDVWIVKVPKYLANAWKSAPPRAELGKLQLPKDKTNSIKFITDSKIQQQPLTGLEKLPDEHKLTLEPLQNQHMVIIAQNKDANATNTSADNPSSDKISFEGDVKHRGELRPMGDMSYMNLKAYTIKQAAKPKKVPQILAKGVVPYKPRGANHMAYEASLRKKKDEPKKIIKEDKEIVQGRLFVAFEKQQYYNIKDLVRITNQSAPYLKEILKEICNYCSRSTHKNMWELKPEYRHYKSASSSGGS